MVTEKKFDFVVVGGGILALSSGLRIKRRFPECSLAIIGPQVDAHSATRCAGAMINVFAEIPRDGFKFLPTTEKLKILLEAERDWDNFCEEIEDFSDLPLSKPRGKTHVILNSRSTPAEVKTFEYIRDWTSDNAWMRDISPAEVPGLSPTDYGFVMRAMTLGDRHINPHRVLAALEVGLKRNGVHIIDDRVVYLNRSGFGLRSMLSSLTTSSGETIAAGSFVFANGFDPTNDFSDVLGVLPVFANGGAALRLTKPDWVKQKGGLGSSLDDLDDVIRMVDRGGACGIHIVPEGNGSFYVGASSAVWTNAQYLPKLSAVQVLINSAINELNREFWHYDVSFVGNGFRPCTPDAMPLVGKTGLKNVYCLNGFKRDGFTASPFASRLIIDAIERDDNPIPIFDPTRKLISFKNRGDAINDAMEVSRASMFQHYQHVAPIKEPALEAADRSYILNTYRRVKGDFGIHPEMLHLFADDEYFRRIKPHL